MRIEKLILGKKFGMGWPRAGCRGSNGKTDVHIQCDGRETDLGAAGLVAQLERDVLGTKRGGRERREREPKNYGVFVDIKGLFRKRERAEFPLGIGDFANFESRGDVGLQIRGDEIVLRLFAGVDVEAGANFQDDGELK
jgi:hypothetical protein